MKNQPLLDKLEYNKYLTSYVKSLRKRANENYKVKLNEFSEFRDFSLTTIQSCGIFYIGSMSEMLLPNYIDNISQLGVISETNNKPIFTDRFVIPILTQEGLVENLVGYSKSADERYIYGTSLYYRRRDTLWGLEKIHLAYDMGYAILTEGITDAIRLRDLGFENTFAMCGTHSSSSIIPQLNRCRYGVLRVPDRDKPGLRAIKGWEFNRFITLFPSIAYKDIDEMCKNNAENKQTVKDAMEYCIQWLKKREHRGMKGDSERVTII